MQLKFLYGENLKDKSVAIVPGTIYLDVATGELYFDDPTQNDIEKHNKIIDTATLIYTIEESVTFPSAGDEDTNVPGGDNAGGSTSAKLGVAILGTMILGAT